MKQGLGTFGKALALCAGAFLLSPSAAAKEEPTVLGQSDKWVANFDTESCQLITSFGEGKDKVLFRLSRYSPGDAFVLDLFGNPFKSDQPRSRVKFQFGPNGTWRETETTNGTTGKLPMMMLGNADLLGREQKEEAMLPLITPDQEAAVRWLDIVTARHKLIRLQTGPMGRPMQVMRTCMADLLKSWGFDMQSLQANARPATPAGNPGNWLQSHDYPADMLRQGGQGIVRFRLEVDEAGSVSKCHIQQRTNPDAFADLSCRLLSKRAKFIPALDSSGKPARSIYMNTVRWMLPR